MPPPPSPLLTIPRELRDQILHHSLLYTYSPPPRALHVLPPSHTTTAGRIHNWTSPPRWKPLNLLSVSHQLRHETLSLLHHLHSSQAIHLSLSILTTGTIWTPQWTSLTLGILPQSNVNLQVDLVLLSTSSFLLTTPSSSILLPGPAFRPLLHLLPRFLLSGPTFLDHNFPLACPGPFYIDTLSVHLSFRDDYTPATHPDAARMMARGLKALAGMEGLERWVGRVRVRTEYEVDGRKVRRESGWVVGKREGSGDVGEEDEAWREIGEGFWEGLGLGSDGGGG